MANRQSELKPCTERNHTQSTFQAGVQTMTSINDQLGVTIDATLFPDLCDKAINNNDEYSKRILLTMGVLWIDVEFVAQTYHDMRPQRFVMRRTKGWRKPENGVYVGRPSDYGNPYRIGESHASPHETVNAYREYLEHKLAIEPNFLKPLRGKRLGCWCKLGEPCHADVLTFYANPINYLIP